MSDKLKDKDSKFITKKNYPKFFEILEKKLNSDVKIPKIELKEEGIHLPAKSSNLSYSLFVNKKFWNVLNLNEKVAVVLHEIGHLNSKSTLYYLISFLFLTLVIVNFNSYLFSFIQYSLSSMIIVAILNFLIFRFLFLPIWSFISQKDEYFADDFASNKIGWKYIESALIKIEKEKIHHYLNLIYYFLFFPFKTHSTRKDRIERLKKKSI